MLEQFSIYKTELEQRQDKHERIVKLSRDITIKSKRLIFTLHQTGTSLDDLEKDVTGKLNEINRLLNAIANELKQENPYRFLRAYSGGIQEYIEAVSFLHYLKNRSLLTYEECLQNLTFETETGDLHLFLTWTDYILGIADTTGELMRRSIHCISHSLLDEAQDICSFLRSVHNMFVSFGHVGHDFSKKLGTLKASLSKVEAACYTVHIRGEEMPSHLLADAAASVDHSMLSREDVAY